MIQVIMYKEGQSLKSDFIDRPLSVTEKHILYFCTTHDQLYRQISQNKADVIFYFVDQVTTLDVNHIRRIESNHPESKVVLYSDAAFALQAWKSDVFHFDDQPIDLDKVKRAFAKYVRTVKAPHVNTLTLKMPDGLYNIPHKDIRFLIASGNYTFVHYEADKQLVITKQLGQFDFLTEKNPHFMRIHRSLIIHTMLIKEVDDSSIYFHGSAKPLNISASLASKCKKLLNQFA
jgi:DNA-binding LytR/AlgR family response regulator